MCKGIPGETWHPDGEGPGACRNRHPSGRYVQLQGKDGMGAKLGMSEGNGRLCAIKGGRYEASHTSGRRSWTNAMGKACVCSDVFCHLVNDSACNKARDASGTEGARRRVRPTAHVEPGVRRSPATMVPHMHRGDGPGTVRSLCPVPPFGTQEEGLWSICPSDFLSDTPKASKWCAELQNSAFFSSYYYYCTDRGIVSRIRTADVDASSRSLIDLLTELSGKKQGLDPVNMTIKDDIAPVRPALSGPWPIPKI